MCYDDVVHSCCLKLVLYYICLYYEEHRTQDTEVYKQKLLIILLLYKINVIEYNNAVSILIYLYILSI